MSIHLDRNKIGFFGITFSKNKVRDMRSAIEESEVIVLLNRYEGDRDFAKSQVNLICKDLNKSVQFVE